MGGGSNASAFAHPIQDVRNLVVPTVCLHEVYRRMFRQKGEVAALGVVAAMMEGRMVDLDAALAILAARLGLEHGLPLADSIIYATARAQGATVWTMDTDFEGLEGVRYFARD